MIRYPILASSQGTVARELKELHGLITQANSTWLARAQSATDSFRTAGKYQPGREIWSEIKLVYMTLQQGKCAYCETKIGDQSMSRIEFDVEHFRPKSSVKAWPTAKIKSELNLEYDFALGEEADSGYYLLPFHPLNYLASCKKCNSNCKSDSFPVSGAQRYLDAERFSTLKKEKCLLAYPLGSIDEDPEQLITFQGVTPVPVTTTGPRNRRARVIIDFFRLAIREDLLFERAVIISNLFIALNAAKNGTPAFRRKCLTEIDKTAQPYFPHSNCAKAFCRTFQQDPAQAERYYESAQRYSQGWQTSASLNAIPHRRASR